MTSHKNTSPGINCELRRLAFQALFWPKDMGILLNHIDRLFWSAWRKSPVVPFVTAVQDLGPFNAIRA